MMVFDRTLEVLDSSSDGSCWTFSSSDETIIFFFLNDWGFGDVKVGCLPLFSELSLFNMIFFVGDCVVRKTSSAMRLPPYGVPLPSTLLINRALRFFLVLLLVVAVAAILVVAAVLVVLVVEVAVGH